MIHSVAFTLGYLLLILCGMAVSALLILAVTKLVNRALWALLDCYGSIKTFDDYRRWYRANHPASKS